MTTILLNDSGKVVNVGDVVKCWANEPWIFHSAVDSEMAIVSWDGKDYVMPLMAIGCRVVQLPTVAA